MTTSIRKALITGFGDIENLTVVSDTLPPPPKDHAQVRVHYSGFAGSDINMRRGTYPMQPQPPLTPGYCFVGTVVSLGPGCSSGIAPGDLVCCLTVHGSETTFGNFPEKHLHRVPSGLNLQQAVAIVLDWNTAYGIIKSAGVQKGHKVFVHGISGAVGNAISTLCQREGAEVYGTASARNHDAVKARGGRPFVYTDKNWMKAMKDLGGADAVFDPLGFESWDESYEILNNKGILLGYGGNLRTFSDKDKAGSAAETIVPTMKLLARNYLKVWDSRRTTFYYIERNQVDFKEGLQNLYGLLSKGEIDVPIKAVWDLEDIRSAHEGWATCPGVGSLVIRINEE